MDVVLDGCVIYKLLLVLTQRDVLYQKNLQELLALWSITLHDIYCIISLLTVLRLSNLSFLQSVFPLFILCDIYCPSHSVLFSLSILSYLYRLALHPCLRSRLHHKYTWYAWIFYKASVILSDVLHFIFLIFYLVDTLTKSDVFVFQFPSEHCFLSLLSCPCLFCSAPKHELFLWLCMLLFHSLDPTFVMPRR